MRMMVSIVLVVVVLSFLSFSLSLKTLKSSRASSLLVLSLKSPLYDNEIGSLPPLGFWDPLGLLLDADQDRFDRLRYVEMKHGNTTNNDTITIMILLLIMIPSLIIILLLRKNINVRYSRTYCNNMWYTY